MIAPTRWQDWVASYNNKFPTWIKKNYYYYYYEIYDDRLYDAL